MRLNELVFVTCSNSMVDLNNYNTYTEILASFPERMEASNLLNGYCVKNLQENPLSSAKERS